MARKNKNAEIVSEEVVDPKAAKKAEKKAKNKLKKKALLAVLQFANENSPDGDMLANIALLAPSNRGGGGGTSKMTGFVELFTDNLEVSGLQVYQDYGYGQGEMRKVVRNLIKQQVPDSRIWVHYDKPSDLYSVMGRGATPPEEWTGYRPVEIDDVEIV